MDETPKQPDATATPDTEVQDALAGVEDSIQELQDSVNNAITGEEDSQRMPEPIDLLGDVNLEVSIELGRTEMLVEDVLKLGAGSVVELDKLAGDPVDVYVNGRLVARGEVLVLNDNFCIRVSEIVANLEEQAELQSDAALATATPMP